MCRLLTFLIILGLLSGCFEADAPAATQAPLPENTSTPELSSELSPELSPDIPSPAETDRQIVLVADPWCPHNCAVDAPQEGYMVDIAREALAMAGYTLKYRNISWARALRMARQGKVHGVVGAFKTDAPDFVFPEVAQGRASIGLYTRLGNDWRYAGIASLKNQTLLAINGYSYTAELDSYINNNRENRERIWILSGPAPLERALSLLEKQRGDLFAEDDYVMDWAIRNNPEIDRPRRAGQVDETLSYVAFSPALSNSDELARLLSEGTRTLVENGRMNAILKSYGLSAMPATP
jgi:polar amino acid transport system substrate-binding protein